MLHRQRAHASRTSASSRLGRKAPALQHHAFPSPTIGWFTSANAAAPPANSAQVLENFYPTSTGISMRRGCLRHASGSSTGEPVESLMSYVGATRKLFAGVDGNIIDVTNPADPDVEPTADVTGQTSNYYSALNTVNPAGDNYLMVANGSDEVQTYDGSSWSALVSGSSPGELVGLDSTTVDHLNSYRNRIWMTNRTMTVYYLPTDSIAGTVGTVELAGVFRRGGYVVFTSTWSMDGGDGLAERIVFATTEGEFAVYQGDPSDAGTWRIAGLYDCSPPLGKNAFLKVGGDLLILTEVGLVSMSAVATKDPAAIAISAVSRNIQPDWQAEVQARRSLPWEIIKWTSRNIAYVTCPVTSAESVTPSICLAVNLETGAWSKVTGWNTRCFSLHDHQAYFGTGNGRVMKADVTGLDDGQLIYYTYVGGIDHLKSVGRTKTVAQARAVFSSRTAFNPVITVSTDYEVELAPFPSAAPISETPNEWDVGKWDQAKWDAASSQVTVNTGWVSVGRTGFAHSPQVQITSGNAAAPAAELVLFEALYHPGGRVV